MTRPITPAQRQRLLDALTSLTGPLLQGAGAERKILHLISYHKARRTSLTHSHALSCAGVRATCTWSDCEGLLLNWNLTAQRRLSRATHASEQEPAPYV